MAGTLKYRPFFIVLDSNLKPKAAGKIHAAKYPLLLE